MSKYTFTFKKDNIFVEFTTEDRDVVERQFQIWVADADEYARSHKSNAQKEKTINTIAKEAEKAKEEIKMSDVEKTFEGDEIELQQEQPVSDVSIEVESEVKEEGPVFDKASSLLKTINSIQNETVGGEIGESNEKADFEAVLEQTIENPTFEPEKTKDQIFLNLLRSKNTTDKFHYLIITSYYLSEFEKMERFSLKQINAKLMQNLSEVIDHAMLQEAINQNLIELIPDLTGISGVGEYKLTQLGEEFFANKI